MKLTELTIHNFMAVTDIKTRLDNRGLVLIQGRNTGSTAFESNGSGKSTVFSESICWCLFGETIRGYKGNDVVNNKETGGTMVSISLEEGENVFTVERYRKHKEHKNSVRLFKNGENITGKSDADTTAMIEDILQMDFMSFTNSILFGQGISKKFANSTDAEQKKILERMLQIDLLKVCQDLAKKYCGGISQEIVLVERTISSLSDQLKKTLDTVSTLQDKESELGDAVRVRVSKAIEELTELTKELEELGTIDSLEEVHKKILEQSSKLDRELEEFQPVEEEWSHCKSQVLALDMTLKSLGKEINRMIDDVEEVESGKAKPKVCKSCGQTIPLDNPQKLIDHLNTEIDSKNAEYDTLEDKQSRYKEKIEKLEEVLKDKRVISDKRATLIQSMAEVRTEIRSYEKTKSRLVSSIKSKEKYIEEQNQLLDATYSELIEQNMQDALNLKESIAEQESHKKDLQSELEKYDFWVNAFGNQGIKSVMLQGVTPFLNTRINHYLGKLSDNTMSVIVDTETTLATGEKRDKFSIEVINTLGSADYKGCSGGEKQRMDVAINMALQDLILSRSNKKIDLLVFDEAFEALDPVGCEKVVELLKEKESMFGTILVITHNGSLAEHFSNSLTVVKSDTGVTLEE